MIDIDRFKRINDVLGHQAGDEALRRIARVLMRSTRVVDRAYRIAGDEFAVLLPLTARADALVVARRLQETVAAEFATYPQEARPSISAGVASYPGDAGDLQALFAVTDVAMYNAKRAGGNRVAPTRSGGATDLPRHP
jgi:diguanylate cyclase (GGDEF)-like protein